VRTSPTLETGRSCQNIHIKPYSRGPGARGAGEVRRPCGKLGQRQGTRRKTYGEGEMPSVGGFIVNYLSGCMTVIHVPQVFVLLTSRLAAVISVDKHLN